MKSVAEILKALREDSDLTQSEVAKLIGTTQQQYSKYENSESELPVRVLSILANSYNVSADYLVGLTECREGLEALNKMVTDNVTVGGMLSDVLLLDLQSRKDIIEYIRLQKIKRDHTPD
jgi:Predicted transcriptional regulators